jgi:cytidylate kinase
MNTVMRTLGGALGGQVAATLLAGSLGVGGLPSDEGYALAFGMCAGAVVIGGVASLLIPGRRKIGLPAVAVEPASDFTGRPAPLVITISAPYGAGGSLVGPRLADRLGVHFLDRAIPRAVSARLDVPVDDAVLREELPQGTLSRLISRFDPAVQMFAGASAPPEGLALDDEEFRTATEQVLHDFAATGGVMLGRGAAIVLRDVPHVLKVRLEGPRERRILQAMRRDGIDRAVAEKEMRAADVSRDAYVRHWYHVDPNDPGLYDLCIDSTSIELDACVELIALASGSAKTANR